MIGLIIACVLAFVLYVLIVLDMHQRDHRYGDRDDWPHR